MGMNKSITTLFESEMVEWMNILTETETPFKITNLSDYSGVQYKIEWHEWKPWALEKSKALILFFYNLFSFCALYFASIMAIVPLYKIGGKDMDKYEIKWSIIMIVVLIILVLATLSLFGELDEYWVLSIPACIVTSKLLANEERKNKLWQTEFKDFIESINCYIDQLND